MELKADALLRSCALDILVGEARVEKKITRTGGWTEGVVYSLFLFYFLKKKENR